MSVIHQQVALSLLSEKQVSLIVKREDLNHPFISGNKLRKLKYNLIEAQNQGHHTIVTFGGAYSNHIAATAYAGREMGLRTVGIIRGEELREGYKSNPTLAQASKNGMEFIFITREQYRDKSNPHFLRILQDRVGEFYLVPEGGTNDLAIKGCEEILEDSDHNFDYICCSVGTGGTLAGIINSSDSTKKVIGFASLKGDFLTKDIRNFVTKDNWEVRTDYHFGGYAKVSGPLISFINWLKRETGIPTDPIYTGKLFYGVLDLMKQNYFKPGSSILVIHTGGLQGIEGMNLILKKRQQPLIEV
ncbi:1-aminocyclopropane-1-carboxylate deaminase/D-cysteine desulfhydrase [Arenibacter certesii]|uniref:1-aminocyclopropane-1-carboxylate deaminase n=1 Tax=Arenibacter certesii TaxID=228955 RepID=A0A918J582_9FLAO|nr:pyridoxal-phosphate dependent enzyme [Arenibacter certesii]GGW47565.1 1-aminocyclopropane-1-carboxylate deaminase [Arenibacter certesii]